MKVCKFLSHPLFRAMPRVRVLWIALVGCLVAAQHRAHSSWRWSTSGSLGFPEIGVSQFKTLRT